MRVGVGPEGVAVPVGGGVAVGSEVDVALGATSVSVGVLEGVLAVVAVGRPDVAVGFAGVAVALDETGIGAAVLVAEGGALGVTATTLPFESIIHWRTNTLRSPKLRATCLRPLKAIVPPGRFSTRK